MNYLTLLKLIDLKLKLKSIFICLHNIFRSGNPGSHGTSNFKPLETERLFTAPLRGAVVAKINIFLIVTIEVTLAKELKEAE